jgi:cytochrome c peroxidase
VAAFIGCDEMTVVPNRHAQCHFALVTRLFLRGLSPEGPYYDSGLHTWLGGNFWDGRVPDLAKQGLQPPINPNEMANRACTVLANKIRSLDAFSFFDCHATNCLRGG